MDCNVWPMLQTCWTLFGQLAWRPLVKEARVQNVLVRQLAAKRDTLRLLRLQSFLTKLVGKEFIDLFIVYILSRLSCMKEGELLSVLQLLKLLKQGADFPSLMLDKKVHRVNNLDVFIKACLLDDIHIFVLGTTKKATIKTYPWSMSTLRTSKCPDTSPMNSFPGKISWPHLEVWSAYAPDSAFLALPKSFTSFPYAVCYPFVADRNDCIPRILIM